MMQPIPYVPFGELERLQIEQAKQIMLNKVEQSDCFITPFSFEDTGKVGLMVVLDIEDIVTINKLIS